MIIRKVTPYLLPLSFANSLFDKIARISKQPLFMKNIAKGYLTLLC